MMSMDAPSAKAEADDVRLTLQQDFDRQHKALAVALGASVESRVAIYLDTRFWIILRDAQRGEHGVLGQELLGRFRRLVTSGKAFCPISDAVIFELFKQSDLVSRMETAALVDELSLRVALLSEQERWATEMNHFIHSHTTTKIEDLHPLRHLVWTRGLGVMTLRVPHFPSLPIDAAVRLQRKMLNQLWHRTTISQVLQEPPPWGDDDDDFRGLTNQINIDVALYKDRLKSFAQTYADEAAGAADVCGDMIMAMINDMAVKHGHTPIAPDTEEWSEQRRMWCGFITVALRKGPSRLHLRSMHVGAALHAAFRWNKGQRFDPNDLYDFQHAGAALAHCQVFLTEKPLWQIITANNVALDKMFGCRVAWRLEDAIDILRDLET